MDRLLKFITNGIHPDVLSVVKSTVVSCDLRIKGVSNIQENRVSKFFIFTMVYDFIRVTTPFLVSFCPNIQENRVSKFFIYTMIYDFIRVTTPFLISFCPLESVAST